MQVGIGQKCAVEVYLLLLPRHTMRRGREFAHTPADMGIWHKTFGVNPRPAQLKAFDVGTPIEKWGEGHIEHHVGGVENSVFLAVECSDFL